MENKLRIHADRPGLPLGDFYGIFFEDINHSADGGVYAELVQNRSFEFDPVDNASYHALTAWEKVETGSASAFLSVETDSPLNDKNRQYLALGTAGTGFGAGVRNLGFGKGLCLSEGAGYRFSCWARSADGKPQRLALSFSGERDAMNHSGGALPTSAVIVVESKKWTKYTAQITAESSSSSGRLCISLEAPGAVHLDCVSVFPEKTFRGRANGMREDLVSLLASLKPRFMRFPGGCLVHDGSLDPAARDSLYRWKNTLGPIEERPSRRNSWGYNQSLGLGFFEYFVLCEDIGAKPLPVLPAGYDPHHKWAVPLDELQGWIDDALDLIEFANGSALTGWGRVRSELGHPAPFNLEYLAIGNEEVGEAFFERYPLFHRAIRERYPDIKLINSSGPFAAGSEYERGWASARREGSDLVDEHFYQAPEWFIANHDRYDSFDPEGPGVFLGEWASWGNTWRNALVEASFMTALERNADRVRLACYAPLLCHVDYANWKPDLIYFDGSQAFGSANYHVQKLFMTNLGDESLSCELQAKKIDPQMDVPLCGGIALSGNQVVASFRHISLRNLDTGEVKSYPDVAIGPDSPVVELDRIGWPRYAVEVTARRTEGSRGFFIHFARNDDKERCFWETGGWQNQDSTVCAVTGGRISCLTQSLFEVESGRDYLLRLEVDGRKIRTWIDTRQQDEALNRLPEVRSLYVSAARDLACGEIIIKAVNLQADVVAADVEVCGASGSLAGKLFEISGIAPDAENTFDCPDLVSPREYAFSSHGPSFAHLFPPHSVSVWRLREKTE